MSCAGSEDSGRIEPPEIDSLNRIDEPNNVVNAIADTDTANYAFAGIDEDCDAHFRAAMNREKPEDLVILHCEYWRSGHPVWLEHTYRFEIEANPAFFNDVVEYNQMVKMPNQDRIEAEQSAWFLPKTAASYEGFYTEDDFDDFEIFRDVKTGTIFIRGSQS